jgi:tRNA pseudouridine55 synthase
MIFTKNSQNFDFQTGQVILIDKPLDWTSFDVVNKLKHATKAKTGHAGTLDPLATGLVILCTGKMTKGIQELQDQEKEYTGTICLGATRPSYDQETDIDQTFETAHITPELIQAATLTFLGEIDQIPPIFSAIKMDGKTAYNLARKGKEVEMKSRRITIYEFEITGIEMPLVHFRVRCSKGTYIRSLAYDFGRALNSGAYLHDLRRTKSGNFTVEDAWTIPEITEYLFAHKDLILHHAGIQKR